MTADDEIRTRDIDPIVRASRSARGLRVGADDEIRTRDIDLGKVALYQLSYIRRRPRLDPGLAMLPERGRGQSGR